MCTILNCISHLFLNIGSHDKSMPIWAVRATWALHLEGGGGRSGGRPVLGGAYKIWFTWLTYRYFCIVVPMLNNEHHLSRERGWGRVHALSVHWSNWKKGKYSDKKNYMHVYSRICTFTVFWSPDESIWATTMCETYAFIVGTYLICHNSVVLSMCGWGHILMA